MTEQFKSYPSHSCFISIEKINGDNLLKIDFSVKNYQVIDNFQSKTYNFPPNIVINDQIYLDKRLTNELINALEIFTKTEYLDRKYKTNSLGFPYKEWNDVRGNTLLIEDSGSMNAASIVLSCKINDILIKNDHGLEKYQFKFPENNIIINNKLNLSPERAEQLIQSLQKQWILNEVKELEESLTENKTSKNKLKI